MDVGTESFVMTRAAQNKKNPEKLHVVAVHEAHKKVSKSSKNKSKKTSKPNGNGIDDDEMETDEKITLSNEEEKDLPSMNRLRHEIIKFGMSGFEKGKAVEAKIALAVSLGAKPPKNRMKNYKKLVQEKKIEKKREEKKKREKSDTVSGFNPTQLKMNAKMKQKKGVPTNDISRNKKGNFKKHKNYKRNSGILGTYGKIVATNKSSS